MDKVTGYIDNFIFQNEENGYRVLTLATEEGELVCVGVLNGVAEGMSVEFSGSYTEHPAYGRQFKVESYEEKEPEDALAVARYLGSGAIKGIGKALAKRIVQKFGTDTFRIIEEEPERLAEVKGINERKARDVAAQVTEKRDLRQAMIFLQQFGISLALAGKIHQKYGPQVYAVIRENPYRLADDIQGVGFKIADEIAKRVGIQADSDFRIRSGILYALQQAAADGHTYQPKEALEERVAALLGVDAGCVEKNCMDLAIARRVILKQRGTQTHIYAASYYNMEHNIARMLLELNVQHRVSMSGIEKRVALIEKENRMELDDLQREAVCEAMRNGLFIVTGGPGTGKTTTINTIIRLFELEGMDFLLAAPTGRAAKRMSETTGYEARTIHRLLEINGGLEGTVSFDRDETNPLEADAVIIDEMSMVDVWLMHSLLKAIAPTTRLILVGDTNQLPSVGPGSVLKDLIDAGIFRVVYLSRIFRQAAQSDIIVNAHKINRGEAVTLDNQSRDFFFLKRYDADKIMNVVLQLVIQKMPKYVDADMYDIQVLTPMQRGAVGATNLNLALQEALNPVEQKIFVRGGGAVSVPKEVLRRSGFAFRADDKVMQIRNNYDKEVFNGDIGIIASVSAEDRTLKVNFDGRMVEYDVTELDELSHAYATTIHKAQGSEYPIVVMPILMNHYVMLQRNLIYTGITRAKKVLVMVGTKKALSYAVHNVTVTRRNAMLKERLADACYFNPAVLD